MIVNTSFSHWHFLCHLFNYIIYSQINALSKNSDKFSRILVFPNFLSNVSLRRFRFDTLRMYTNSVWLQLSNWPTSKSCRFFVLVSMCGLLFQKLFTARKSKWLGKQTYDKHGFEWQWFLWHVLFLFLLLLLLFLPAWIYNYWNCVGLLFLNCMRYPIWTRLERPEFKHKRFVNGTKKAAAAAIPITAIDIYCVNTIDGICPVEYIGQFMQINCHSFQL